VARARNRFYLRIRDNFEVDLEGCRGVEAVRDLRDQFRGFGLIRWRNVSRRDGGRDGEANRFIFDREFRDVVEPDLGPSSRFELSELDPENIRGRLF